MEDQQNHRPSTLSVGTHFLEFSIQFFHHSRNQFQQQNCIKAGTQAFHALVILSELEAPPLTMSQLAARLAVTKQQLTRLVNDLEDKGLVQREHDSANRRLVYLTITPAGQEALAQLKADMLTCTAEAMEVYTDEELKELDTCLTRLSELLERFQPEPVKEPDLKEDIKK